MPSRKETKPFIEVAVRYAELNSSSMKRMVAVATILLGLSVFKADAQYVRVRPGFSVGISIGAPGPAPFAGGIWVGPEWRWRSGRYVEVPGYWEKHQRMGGHRRRVSGLDARLRSEADERSKRELRAFDAHCAEAATLRRMRSNRACPSVPRG